MKAKHGAVLLLLAMAAGCGGGEGAPAQTGGEEAGEAATAEMAMLIEAPTGAVNAELAGQGESLFQAKGCVGCHTVGGGRLTGPDLDGIAERREFGWLMAMVQRPDSMLQNDEVAKELLAEYMTPMVNMGVTQEEALAIYEYLRQ
jgi:mono/diheme cytochrome c family protein